MTNFVITWVIQAFIATLATQQPASVNESSATQQPASVNESSDPTEEENMAAAPGSTNQNFVSEETRLILMGKTGSGKSSTGNTITAKRSFDVEFSASSVTQLCQHLMFQKNGRDILLLDTPGFFGTGESQESIEKELQKRVILTSPGVHAILLVIGMGRYTEEEVMSMERSLKFFGTESKHHVIVIFTRKDELEKDGKSLKDFIDTNKKLKTFIKDTGGNYIAVHNDPTVDNEEFVRRLLELVDKIVRKNRGHLTNKMYKEAESKMKKIQEKELSKLLSKNQGSDEQIIADAVQEYSQTLSGYSGSEQKRLLSMKRKALEDERRKIHEREARRNARHTYDTYDIDWTKLAGIVALCAVGIAGIGVAVAAMGTTGIVTAATVAVASVVK